MRHFEWIILTFFSVLDTTAAMLILQAGLLLVQPLFLAGILWWSQAKDIQKICIKFSAIAGLLEIPLVFFMSFHVGIGKILSFFIFVH